MAMRGGSVSRYDRRPEVRMLVFVEGVPGAGKSTTAQFLARQLVRHGRPARWFYEEEAPNPFVPAEPGAGYRDWEEYIDLRIAAWRTLANDRAGASETLIAESALLQAPVFSMLRRDAAPVLVERLVNGLAGAVAPLAPRLIYLSHPEPARAWRAIAARRGGQWVAQHVRRAEEYEYLQTRGLSGLDGLLAYWQAHGALCDAIASWLPMETMVVVARGDWAEHRARICKFLVVPNDEAPMPDVQALARFAGRYRQGEREITVALDDRRLVLNGALWPSNTLLPAGDDVFEVEAWPFRIHFHDGALEWRGPRLWWGEPVDGVYRRVTG